jgi:hypothetical protein
LILILLHWMTKRSQEGRRWCSYRSDDRGIGRECFPTWASCFALLLFFCRFRQPARTGRRKRHRADLLDLSQPNLSSNRSAPPRTRCATNRTSQQRPPRI